MVEAARGGEGELSSPGAGAGEHGRDGSHGGDSRPGSPSMKGTYV